MEFGSALVLSSTHVKSPRARTQMVSRGAERGGWGGKSVDMDCASFLPQKSICLSKKYTLSILGADRISVYGSVFEVFDFAFDLVGGLHCRSLAIAAT